MHRDLKPENVALDNFGQVIVLDWGLAKLIGDAELDENLTHDASDGFSGDGRTMAGQVLGTPMYMAPEQAAGRHDEIDHRTDVYGLGAILFAILTGYAPHEKSHSSLSTGSKVTELFRAIVTNPTPPARSIVPDVPPELDAICTKAMARKRYARYDSASDLADDVQKWTAGEPVSSYAEPWPKQLQRWIGAHRLFSQIAAVLFTVFVVVVTTLSVTSRQNRLAARQARFDILKSEGRELEVRLQHGMRHLTQEVRFMSALPPIQGIIDARSGQGTDEEHVWQERLQTIYKGLLNSQPDYLSVQYVSVAEPAQEIVRVERQASDGSFVRVVPESRLANLESTGPLASIAALHPGDVFLADAPLSHTLQQTELAQALVLTAGIPVFDDTTGEIFGAVAIRTNLEKTLRELISATSKTAAAVYIVGGDGNVVLHYSRGRGFQRVAGRQNIGALVAEVGPFFAQKQTSDVYSAGEEVYAFKIPLDERHANTTLGIVLTLR